MKIKITFCLWQLIGFATVLCGQAVNDDCISSIFIRDIQNYCSEAMEFTTSGATGSSDLNPICWPEGTITHDIWFSFAPSEPGAFIQLTGETNLNLGSLNQPSMAVYDGSCLNLSSIACGSAQPGEENIVELNLTGLVIGRIYYLRIDGRNNNTGSFQLCINSFVPVPQPESDCIRSVVLCDKTSFFIENLEGTGNDNNEVGLSCINQEFASVWYTWTVENSGTLTFTLTPNNIEDDLDFAVYLLPEGIRNCENRQIVRCMASGETVGAPIEQNLPCMGITGLREESGDTQEVLGCQPGDDNFLSPLQMTSGETYALIVNNFSQSGFGFSIDFGGTGTFLGPEPDFIIDAQQEFECDKTITFSNESLSQTDSIVGWDWNFGEGAAPTFRSGEGPHDVIYDSFGDKVTALTVETDKGCRVTKIIDLFVDACCADTSTLRLELEADDLICFGADNGLIEARAFSGNLGYRYSDNGIDFQPSPFFSRLASGNYSIVVQDKKGCETGATVIINEPPPLEVVVGAAEDTVDLGFGTFLNSNFSPNDRIITYEWTPAEGLSCTDCQDPEVVPPGTTTYTLQITDQDGCQTSRDITVFTTITRPFYAPTAISLRSQSGNEQFKIFLNIAAEEIELLAVFDRWGNLLFEEKNIVYSDSAGIGWDGRFNGKEVNNGVYVWVAKVRFIDDEVVTFTGDLTVFN